MALKQVSRDYEILIRYNDNGKLGAHRQTITEIVNGNVVLAANIDAPVPLTLEELQSVISSLTSDDWYSPPAEGSEVSE